MHIFGPFGARVGALDAPMGTSGRQNGLQTQMNVVIFSCKEDLGLHKDVKTYSPDEFFKWFAKVDQERTVNGR